MVPDTGHLGSKVTFRALIDKLRRYTESYARPFADFRLYR